MLTWEHVEIALQRVLDEDEACDAVLAIKEAGFSVLSHEEVGTAIDAVATQTRTDSAAHWLLRKLQADYANAPTEDDAHA